MDHRIIEACKTYAARLAVPEANLLAFVEVESAGVAFADVGGRDRALIRWEGHYFYRRLKRHDAALKEAISLGLAARRAGQVKNPREQAARYGMLAAAAGLCSRHNLPPDLAYECVSVGLGQVMAAHWKALGYESAHDMIARAHDETAEQDILDQIDMMVRYLVANDLLDDLARGDWTELARAYNGPNYAVNSYDTKLAEAARRWAGGSGTTSEYPTLRVNDSGPLVSALQERLTELGYPFGARDGHFGPVVRASVLAFQAEHNLAADGIAGPATWRAMEKSSGRPVSAARAVATARDLRAAGSGTVRAADYGQAAGVVLGGLGGAGGLSQVETGVRSLTGLKAALAEFWGTGQELLPFILIAAGAGVIIVMHIVKKRRVADHRSGANLGR